MKKIIALMLIALPLAACDTTQNTTPTTGGYIQGVTEGAPITTAPAPTAPPTTIRPHHEEDDPGWDCHLDGDKVCGPDATAAPAPAPDHTNMVQAEDGSWVPTSYYDHTDASDDHAGMVQAEDGSWVPTSYYNK